VVLLAASAFLVTLLMGGLALAQRLGATPHQGGGEDSLKVPEELDTQLFFGLPASKLLMLGLGVCALGIVFGLVVYRQLKNAPVHKAMLEVSELIYETCKTYLVTQAKFLGLLWLFIGAVIVVYYGVLKGEDAGIVFLILAGHAGGANRPYVRYHGRAPATRQLNRLTRRARNPPRPNPNRPFSTARPQPDPSLPQARPPCMPGSPRTVHTRNM
jgi:hypothetical protein